VKQTVKGDVFLNARWQFKLSGLYQLPHDWTVGGFYQWRDGYPSPIFLLSGSRPQGLGRALLFVEPVGDRGLEEVIRLGLRFSF
jgi:hypothetical protein